MRTRQLNRLRKWKRWMQQEGCTVFVLSVWTASGRVNLEGYRNNQLWMTREVGRINNYDGNWEELRRLYQALLKELNND